MQAEFVQTVMSESTSQVDESRGILRLQRPGKFRWDYQRPYEQQIIADGEKLWVYDVDMDQVIVKPLDYVLGNTPAILLSGNVNLTEKFIIEELPPESSTDNVAWLKLTPKQEDSGFQQLVLAFKDDILQQMQLVDSFGQMTRISFTKLIKNPDIDASVFTFTPPAGVDVISDF
jgi:outer membrane lipoprotein carrier protein